MPVPKILSNYSPAFKRKSLNTYNNNNNNQSQPIITKSNGTTQQLGSPASDAPKSLESICSPTRSDYSFDFVSSSTSPENNSSSMNNKPKLNGSQRKNGRNEYDDSDNDSAVSSSQSSISRGFSPPMSPVPSDNNNRSYENMHYQRSQLIVDKNINYTSKSISKPVTIQIPLKRTNSTDTTTSNSSTLTSGSQASTESLSRRVLKPQSVEAINRKNILASARCRSGRDLNGSPLIQRKFSDDEEEGPVTKDRDCKKENGGFFKMNGNTEVDKPQIKRAYIEIMENSMVESEREEIIEQKPRLPPKRNIIPQSMNTPIRKYFDLISLCI